MRISRLYMPAVTLAGALALAGCGGGSDTPANPGGGGGNSWTIPAGEPLIIGNTTFTCTGDTDCVITDLTNLPANVTRTTAPPEGITSAQCGDGRIPNDAKTMCVDDPDHVDPAVMTKAAKDLFGNLEHVTVADGGVASRPSAGEAFVDAALVAEIVDAVEAIKDGRGTAASDDGEISVTAYRLGGKREKTATANSYTNAQLTTSTDDDIRKAIMSSAFTGTGEPVTLFTGSAGNLIYRTSGSYNGAAGTYTCATDAGETCVARNTPDNGVYLGGTGEWTFAPSAGEKEYTSAAASITFGHWLDTGNANTGAASRAAGTWYESSGLVGRNPAEDPALVGTAKYKGTAAGLAALYSALPGATGNVGGEFEADAELTATFGASPMLEGMITNFSIGDHSPDWTVELVKTPITGNGTASDGSPKTKWSIGADDPSAAESGGWRASLLGTAATNATAAHPGFVAGAFNSEYGGAGRMVGAFGAEKKSEAAE